MPRFVVQEHFARTHHFDFRLEKDGVLRSWAVPKGIPDKPGVKRLAVQVEDHDLSFGDFEGEIPPGNYGAGRIRIFDSGEYDNDTWSGTEIQFTLHGSRFEGPFTLLKFQRGKEGEWLIIKRAPRTPSSNS